MQLDQEFAQIAKPITELTKQKAGEFCWTDSAQKAMEILKTKATQIAALKKLDIKMAKEASLTCKPGKYNEGRLVLAVDSSMVAVGFVLYQVFRSNDSDLNPDATSTRNSKLIKFPLRYGSITLNQVESRYGQPKIELYGLFPSIKSLGTPNMGFQCISGDGCVISQGNGKFPRITKCCSH